MQTLFSTSKKKEDLADAAAETDRSRIQATIDRALLMPEAPAIPLSKPVQSSRDAELTEIEEMKQFILREELSETAA
ncbi:MAG TPA: hypothetical protein VHZ28_00835 [Terracidiphilus sp.]|jgi:hypothetical protein|nr:hypothetical protein [Terracidiphilus sp.]